MMSDAEFFFQFNTNDYLSRAYFIMVRSFIPTGNKNNNNNVETYISRDILDFFFFFFCNGCYIFI